MNKYSMILVIAGLLAAIAMGLTFEAYGLLR